MELAKKRALLAIGIIIVGIIIYQLLGLYVKNKSNVVNKQYSKTYDLCRVLTKCSDHSMEDVDMSDTSFITERERSKKNCELTKTNIPWRKNFKCNYWDNGASNYSTCSDCLDPTYKNELGEDAFRCGLRKHDLDTHGSEIPDYAECLNMTGTNEVLDKRKIKKSYGLDIKDLNDDNRYYRGLTNDWWKKHPHLYECLTAKDEYLNSNWNDGYHDDYASSSFYRTLGCSACFNIHGDNKSEFKQCMDEQARCYKDAWPINGTNCDIMDDLLDEMNL